jgi:hypothetical protein
MMTLFRILPLIAALAACQQAPEKKAPPAANTAQPAPAAQGPLAVYVGKTIFEPVEGTAFAGDERVTAPVELALRNEEPRAWVFRRDTQQRPIVLSNGRLLAHGCERGNCGGRSWTILIDTVGAIAEVCYHSGGRSRWWGSGRAATEQPGPCPEA